MILSSNGFTAIIEKAFLQLLKKPPQENSVAFITTAAFGEEDGPEWNTPTWLEIYRNQLRSLGIVTIEDIDLKDKKEEELQKLLETKDIVFVNGGNTFYLMYWVKKSGFDNVLSSFLKREGIYFGVSAGSIITNPTIETAGWEPADKNNVELEDLRGLGLVNFLIHPHFVPEEKGKLEEEIKDIDYPVVALTNEQAILVNDNKIQIIGDGNKYFFNEFTES